MAGVSVRKRGDVWQYCFDAASIGGKRRQVTKSGFRTKKAAMEAGVKAKADYDKSGTRFVASEMSVADYLDFFMDAHASQNLKANTVETYGAAFRNHVKPNIGQLRLSSLTTPVLQEYLNTLSKQVSPGVYSLTKKALSSALNYAVNPCQFILANPMANCRTPKAARQENKPVRSLSDDEFRQVAELAAGTRYYLPVMIGYYTGCRIGEICALQWSDVDFDAQAITVRHSLSRASHRLILSTPKTETSRRTIKIGQTLSQILRDERQRQRERRLEYGQWYHLNAVIDDDGTVVTFPIHELEKMQEENEGLQLLDPVCATEWGKICSPRIAARFCEQLKAAGIQFHFHLLRDTHATKLAEAGVPAKVIQTRLGHTNFMITYNRYIAATEKMESDAAEVFDRIACQQG